MQHCSMMGVAPANLTALRQSDHNLLPWQQKGLIDLSNWEKNVVPGIAPKVFIGTSSNLQTSRTTIKS